jgi:hypothetical protein
MSFRQNLQKLRSDPDTANAGAKWSSKEDDELIDRVARKLSIDAICKEHKRTLKSIEARLCMHANEIMTSEDISANDAAERMGISECKLLDYRCKLLKKQAKSEVEKKKPVVENEDSKAQIELLTEIRDLLKKLNSKIK